MVVGMTLALTRAPRQAYAGVLGFQPRPAGGGAGVAVLAQCPTPGCSPRVAGARGWHVGECGGSGRPG
jgi:hypothetical protein